MEKSSLFSDETISEHLSRISSELEFAKESSEGELREVLEKVSGNLHVLKNKKLTAEELEEYLEKMDSSIDNVLLTYFVTRKIKSRNDKEDRRI